MKLQASLISLAFLGCAAAQAQQSGEVLCPSSGLPVSMDPGCWARENANAAQQSQQPPPPPQPTGYWEKTWGAIAGHSSQPILGTAVGANSEAEAKKLALADCKAKGGGSGCRLDLAYHNQCAVLVTGDRLYNTASAGSIERATEIGIEECNKVDTNCRVYYSACTEPIFHQY